MSNAYYAIFWFTDSHYRGTLLCVPAYAEAQCCFKSCASRSCQCSRKPLYGLKFWSLDLPIVCLTRVWQSLFPLFCVKTFEFAIQTWQTSLEHYYVYVQTYFLSQLRKMLILLISSYCKMCTLSTLQSRVFVCCAQYKRARSYC